MSVNTTPIDLTRAQIEQAIRASARWGGGPPCPAEGDMREDFEGYDATLSFEETVADVWQSLCEGPLSESHDVGLNFTWEPSGTTSGAQVEVTLPMTNGYVAAGWNEVKHLTSDRAAAGIDGLVAIADRLIAHANDSLALARPLIESERAALDTTVEAQR